MNSTNPSSSTNSKSILITIDLEDWFQVENLRPAFPHTTWNSQQLRIEKNTQTLLDLFDKHNIQSTFFVLGWLAERCQDLIKEIYQHGHEIASHGYNHQLCSDLSTSALRDDIQKSKAVLENITKQPIYGYRAPNFSITQELVGVLQDLEFKYDSSYNNFALNKRHGKANGLFRTPINNHLTTINGLIELPMSNLEVKGKVIPWSGGGYFRFWPSAVFHSGVKHILKSNGYYIFYCHPWEVDPGQPRVNCIGALSRFRHYLNLDKTLDRLDRFFTVFENCSFTTCYKYLGYRVF